MDEDNVVDLTKNDDDTGLNIPFRRYYLLVWHYLPSLSHLTSVGLNAVCWCQNVENDYISQASFFKSSAPQ